MASIAKFAFVLLAFLAAASSATTVQGGWCDEAKRGTFLSNVCWLVEEFSENSFKHEIPSFDEKNCSVRVDRGFGNIWDTINFDKADVAAIEIHEKENLICWEMPGEGVRGEGKLASVRVCGVGIAAHRIENAFNNLFTKFCTGYDSEF